MFCYAQAAVEWAMKVGSADLLAVTCFLASFPRRLSPSTPHSSVELAPIS